MGYEAAIARVYRGASAPRSEASLTRRGAAAAAHLEDAGFAPDQAVQLTRSIALPDGGEAEGRFSVVGVPPDAMPEGRIQVLAHHRPDIVLAGALDSPSQPDRPSLEAAPRSCG